MKFLKTAISREIFDEIDSNFFYFKDIIIIILARTLEIGQGLGRILSCGNKNRLRWTYDYCGLRTTTLFHDILILP